MFYEVVQGRKATSSLFKNHPDFYLAIGRFPVGYLNGWTTNPPEVGDVTDEVLITEFGLQATELLEEIGRRKVALRHFVTPDELGNIVVNGVYYSISTTKTEYTYLKFILDPTDGGDDNICQMGIFMNVVPLGTVPPGQYWLAPADIEDPGDLYQLQNIELTAISELQKLILEVVIEY